MARRTSRKGTPAPDPRASIPSPYANGHVATSPTTRLGELLLARQAISVEHLEEALSRQPESGQRIGDLLVALGVLDEGRLAAALAEQSDLDLADLSRQTPEDAALDRIPEEVARANNALPLRVVDGVLEVVVSDPSAVVRASVQAAARGQIKLLVAPPTDVRRGIDRSYRALEGIGRHVQAFEASDSGKRVQETAAAAAAVTVIGADAPVIQVVNLVVTQALRDRASDIHIEPQEGTLRVRFRVDGALHDALSLPAGMAGALVSRIKIMANMNIVERRRAQDGQFAMEIDGRGIDVRVSTMSTIWGEKCVMRVLDKSRSLYRLGDLGMPADTHERFGKMVRSPFGMVLCAGPTGSGKTTTLYATLSEINEPHRNIVTIEDPVEYVFASINQIQTNDQAGVTFAEGLRAILRQDPDVILVGEIRDAETARVATQSALTGHFVLSSVHATDSVSALHRFLDMGIESFLIASSVVGIVSQRLVRRICPSCRVHYQPGVEELAFYEESNGPAKEEFWHGAGCNFCSGTGYSDRIGVYELLTITPEIRRLVVGWATQDELRKMAVKQGMRTLRDEGATLVANDVTTISEVIRSIYAL